MGDLNEGFFASLTDDLRREVWQHIDSDQTFAQATRVNHRWHREMEAAWEAHCRKRVFFIDAVFWDGAGRSWKWILQAYKVRICFYF